MSARIEQILEVIEDVKEKFRNRQGYSSIRDIRITAGHSVAARRGITYQAVIDKFVRQLRPQISSASEFDSLLEGWLTNNSSDLKNIILKHKTNNIDEKLINDAFHHASEEEILLSEEFGLTPNDTEFIEGKEKLKLHLIKERNRNLIQLAKKEWRQVHSGDIPCSICSFSFYKKYGEKGKDYIEAHHVIPLSTLTHQTITNISDLAPVCSNCHSIIHRRRPWLSISELRSLID